MSSIHKVTLIDVINPKKQTKFHTFYGVRKIKTGELVVYISNDNGPPRPWLDTPEDERYSEAVLEYGDDVEFNLIKQQVYSE